MSRRATGGVESTEVAVGGSNEEIEVTLIEPVVRRSKRSQKPGTKQKQSLSLRGCNEKGPCLNERRILIEYRYINNWIISRNKGMIEEEDYLQWCMATVDGW